MWTWWSVCPQHFIWFPITATRVHRTLSCSVCSLTLLGRCPKISCRLYARLAYCGVLLVWLSLDLQKVTCPLQHRCPSPSATAALVFPDSPPTYDIPYSTDGAATPSLEWTRAWHLSIPLIWQSIWAPSNNFSIRDNFGGCFNLLTSRLRTCTSFILH